MLFARIASGIARSPERLLLLDDSAANARAARRWAWRAILVTAAKHWHRQLDDALAVSERPGEVTDRDKSRGFRFRLALARACGPGREPAAPPIEAIATQRWPQGTLPCLALRRRHDSHRGTSAIDCRGCFRGASNAVERSAGGGAVRDASRFVVEANVEVVGLGWSGCGNAFAPGSDTRERIAYTRRAAVKPPPCAREAGGPVLNHSVDKASLDALAPWLSHAGAHSFPRARIGHWPDNPGG